MSRAARLFVGLCQVGLCASSAAGCIGIEPQVRGVIHYARTEGCSDVPPRTAASDVTVTLECPGAEPMVTVTPMGGRFHFDADEPLAEGCAVTFVKEGYRARRYAMSEICVDSMEPGASCEAAAVTAHLVPVVPSLPSEEASRGQGADEAPRDEAPRDEVPRDEVPRDEAEGDEGPEEETP